MARVGLLRQGRSRHKNSGRIKHLLLIIDVKISAIFAFGRKTVIDCRMYKLDTDTERNS